MIISAVIDSFVLITDVNEYNAAEKTKSAWCIIINRKWILCKKNEKRKSYNATEMTEIPYYNYSIKT